MQDADQIEDTIKEQVAERALPEAQLWTLLQSLEQRGRPDLAKFYFGELLMILNEKNKQLQQSLAPPQPPMPPPGMMPPPGVMPPPGMAPPMGPPGLPPEVMPNAAMGGPPPMPTPPMGPAVPPGTPRPGALTDEERLARIGLVGAGG